MAMAMAIIITAILIKIISKEVFSTKAGFR